LTSIAPARPWLHGRLHRFAATGRLGSRRPRTFEKRGVFVERVVARLQLHRGFTDADLDEAVRVGLTGLIQSAAWWRAAASRRPGLSKNLNVSQLVAVHLPELGSIQRLKHVADQIPLSSSFQILATDPCFGCIFSTPQCQAPRLVLTIRARHNIAVSYMLKFPLSQKLFRLLAHDQPFGPVELAFLSCGEIDDHAAVSSDGGVKTKEAANWDGL